jgi:predicted DNA-binding transcriptional regulator AlpA
LSTATTVETGTFTYSSLARFLGRSQASLFRDMAAERLPAGFKIGRQQFWLREEIAAWLEAGAPVRSRWEAIKAAK